MLSLFLLALAAFALAPLTRHATSAPFHDSRHSGFASRRDIINLPRPLKSRLVELAERPSTYPPLTVFSEAASPSQLFMYALLDTKNFQPNVFTGHQ
jgi:hypothetical protein